MTEKIIKKLKLIILISALGLLIAYFGLNVMNAYNVWSINYWANVYIQGINSTNIDPTFKAAQIFAINYTAQQLLQTSFITKFANNITTIYRNRIGISGIIFCFRLYIKTI